MWLLDGCYARHAQSRGKIESAGVVGFCFGFGYFLAGLYWIAEAFLVEPWRHGWLLPFVMTALPGGMALFFAAAAALAMLLLVAGSRQGLRSGHRLRPRRVRPRPCADRSSLESHRLWASRQPAADAARFACSGSTPSVSLPCSCSQHRPPSSRHESSRLAGGGGTAALAGLPRAAARAWLWVGRAQARRGRTGQHRYSLAHRPGQYRPSREMAAREQRRDLHRLSRSHQGGGRPDSTASTS